MSTFANSEDPDEMLQHAAFHQSTLFVKVKNILKQKIHFFKYNLTPLDMYNRLSKVYCIKPEGRIH